MIDGPATYVLDALSSGDDVHVAGLIASLRESITMLSEEGWSEFALRSVLDLCFSVVREPEVRAELSRRLDAVERESAGKRVGLGQDDLLAVTDVDAKLDPDRAGVDEHDRPDPDPLRHDRIIIDAPVGTQVIVNGQVA